MFMVLATQGYSAQGRNVSEAVAMLNMFRSIQAASLLLIFIHSIKRNGAIRFQDTLHFGDIAILRSLPELPIPAA
jgi:hypothetical protein